MEKKLQKDSARFMASLLANLADILSEGIHKVKVLKIIHKVLS